MSPFSVSQTGKVFSEKMARVDGIFVVSVMLSITRKEGTFYICDWLQISEADSTGCSKESGTLSYHKRERSKTEGVDRDKH